MNRNFDRAQVESEPSYTLIDVSEMEAPEPMQTILLALQALPIQGVLNVTHRREPFPLYPILKQQGFEYVIESAPTGFLITIWNKAHQCDLAMMRKLEL